MHKAANRVWQNISTVDESSPSTAVSVTGLWKRYGSTTAVSDVSFKVATGQIFGLLGPNGAGKTTTLECILGLRQPDRGSIGIHGFDQRTHAREAKLLLGAQLQSAALQDKITPRQALDLFGSFYVQAVSSDELLARFDLLPKADAAFATLSGGQRQRLFLALALVNQPRLLLLDEPTAGLDPRVRRDLRTLIRAMRDEGRTIVLSTHDLEEAAQLCDQVAIMHEGRIVATGPPGELIGLAQTPARIIVRTDPPLARTVVAALAEVAEAVNDERGWILETRSPARLLADLVRRTDETGAELLEVELRRPTLEDIFIEITGHSWPRGDDPGAAS